MVVEIARALAEVKFIKALKLNLLSCDSSIFEFCFDSLHSRIPGYRMSSYEFVYIYWETFISSNSRGILKHSQAVEANLQHNRLSLHFKRR